MRKEWKEMAGHNELGKNGENQAAIYLEAKGYTIRHRNWRSGKKELDLVAEKDGELVVIEVKTRKNRNYGLPQEAVDERKIRRIIDSADAYLRKFGLDMPVRFDIITLTGNEPPFHIEHICDAFLPPVW